MNKSKLISKWQLRKDVYKATFLETSPDLQKLVKELFDAKIEIFSEFINDLKNLDGDTVKGAKVCNSCRGIGSIIIDDCGNRENCPNCGQTE